GLGRARARYGAGCELGTGPGAGLRTGLGAGLGTGPGAGRGLGTGPGAGLGANGAGRGLGTGPGARRHRSVSFLHDILVFLGHAISTNGVEIDPKKFATIQAWHAPTNLIALQIFLGFVNYVRRFVPDMAKQAAPLTDLLRKGSRFPSGNASLGPPLKTFFFLPKARLVGRP
ncbi:unnamed protein product, partial [Closterium sp. NIES-54]